jgi:putative component of toxin-antitoxin plasmid stabilization module
VIEIRHYVNRVGRDVFDGWLTQLADARAQAKIATPNQPTGCREFWRLQVAASGFVRATDRLGTGLPCLLRDDWQELCVASLWRRQRKQSADIERAFEYLKDYKERIGTS